MKKLLLSLCTMIFISTLTIPTSLADFPIVTDLQVAESLSESTGQPIVLIFGAKSCSACGLLKKDIDDGYFLMQLDSKIVCYIDVTREKELRDKYKIKSIPDTRYIVDGKQKASMIGYERQKYEQWLSNVTIK